MTHKCQHVQSEFGRAQLPEALAEICDGLSINGAVCQGFTYNFGLNIANFKGQPPSVPLSLKDSACNGPNVSFWALNAGYNYTLPPDLHKPMSPLTSTAFAYLPGIDVSEV